MRWPSTRIIRSWLWEQYWLARRPGFLVATLAELRSIIGPEGQREVLLAELSSLTIPTLIIWGTAVQCERFKHNEHGNCHKWGAEH
jgi:pimeloyl-ACP methyl ester carboxylesterase